MEPSVAGALIGAGSAIIIGLVGLVGVQWRGSSQDNKSDIDFVREAATNGEKIDGLANQIKLQHGTLESILGEQRETTKAVVEVATVIRKNGGRT